MTSRIFSIVVLFVPCLPVIGLAEDNTSLRPHVGDPIVIELTGKPAARYLRLFDQPVPDVPDGGFCVPLEARIIRIHHDKLIADYQIITGRDANLQQLVMVTVSFDRQDLTAASIYRTPERNSETKEERLVQATIARQESLPKVRRNSFEGITIRVWSLAKEIAE